MLAWIQGPDVTGYTNERLEELEQQNQKLIEALEFYADESNWSERSTRDYGVVECSFNGGNKAVHDGYKRAQQALDEVDNE